MVKKTYRIYSLTSPAPDTIIMSLEQPKPKLDPNKVIKSPIPGLDMGAKIGERIMKTMFPADTLKLMMPKPFTTDIQLTPQEYEKLGKPTMGDQITLDIKKEG